MASKKPKPKAKIIEATNPLGRPSKYKPEYCEQLVAHMATGLSFECFAGRIGVNRDTLYEWAKSHPAFSDAQKEGQSRAQLWWEEAGQYGLQARTFNSTIWIFNMKNRFKWHDNVKIETTPDQNAATKADVEAMAEKIMRAAQTAAELKE